MSLRLAQQYLTKHTKITEKNNLDFMNPSAASYLHNYGRPAVYTTRKARVANRTREIRLSGMKRGACGNVSYGGTMNPPHIPKGCGSETLCL